MMLLVKATINGTLYRVSIDGYALTHYWDAYILSFSSPQMRMDEKYGGHCKLGFGQISFVPTLFESHSPPPNQISLVIQVARNTEEDAVTLITCDAFLNEFDETRISYDIYDPKYPQDVLDEGPDYNGDTVPYPKAFGTVTHVTPLRLADDGSSRPTYHLGGLSYGTYARVVSTFTSADSGTATTVKTTAAHGYSNGQSISINGSVNFNGTHTISNVTSDTFRIPVAFPNDDSETLPIHANTFASGDLAVYDTGVPIPENVVLNGDGTFSLSVMPVGQVTISGTAAQIDLDGAMTWAQSRLGIGSINTTYARASSPSISRWQTSQQPLIDFMSEMSAFFAHLFYVESDVLYLIDMKLSNGEETRTEKQYLSIRYPVPNATSQVKADWVTYSAETDFVNETDIAHHIKTTENYAVVSLSTVSSGTTDGTSTNKLVDSGATFATDGVTIGMVAYNSTDDTKAIVTDVAETELTLDGDIFVSGEGYSVGPALSYGKEETIEPFHDTRSNIISLLEDILEILNKKRCDMRIPLDDWFPKPGGKVNFTDSMMVTTITGYFWAREFTFDFNSEEIVIEGEGALS